MLYRRRDIKRMFAYSSIEHMGIIVFAFGMAGPLGNFAGLLQMTMHSLTKSAIFFSVGHVTQVKRTQRIAEMGGLTESHPLLGWSLIAGVIAIAGLPPFGVFTSEFLVVSSTFARAPVLAVLLVLGLLIALGRAAAARLVGRVRAGARPGGAGAGLVRAGVRASGAGAGRRRLAAGAAGRVVPARRGAARMILWDDAVARLTEGNATLLGLWGERTVVHLALLQDGDIAHLGFACPDGRYPSLGRVHPPAIRLERAARDLYGLDPVGLPDARPWLDHGAAPTSYPFLPVEGDNLHQVPVGPVHAGIIEPGHFRFTCDGETVVRLEARLGYVHRGIEALMAGAALDAAARLAGRISGDSTVAYALAFARAAEQATGTEPPPRAVWLRALMAELERLANHLGDIGAICNDASFSLMQAHCAVLRERTLRAAATCFGHRLMMDAIIPGGVAYDLAPDGAEALRALLRELRKRFPPLIKLYDATASLQDRTVGTGVLRTELARRFGAGGFVGRASGRDFDARRTPGYPPYDALSFTVPVRSEGDVNARVWVRIEEIEPEFFSASTRFSTDCRRARCGWR